MAAQKTAPAAVFFETLTLMKDHIRLMSVLSFVFFLGGLYPAIRLGGTKSLDSSTSLFFFSIELFIGTLTYVCGFHTLCNALKGERVSFLPTRWPIKFLRILTKEILIVLMAALPAVAGLTAVVFFAVMFMPTAVVGFPQNDWALQSVAFLFILLGVGPFVMRWGFTLPATALGEKASFRKSWRMSKGHAFRMLLFTIPFVFVHFIYQTIVQPQMLSGGLNFLSPVPLAFLAAVHVLFWFAFAAYCVWYIRLAERDKSLQSETPETRPGSPLESQ